MSVTSPLRNPLARQASEVRPRTPLVWATWLFSRLLTLALLPWPREARVLTDVALYHQWSSDTWAGHSIPGRDFPWEYPPGALPVILLPGHIADLQRYTTMFICLMLLVDAAILALLLRRSGGTGGHGVVLWLLAVPLLGPMVYARLDLVPTLLCMLGLHLADRRRAAGSAFLGVATLVKLWPLVAFTALFSGRPSRSRLAAYVLTCAVALLLLWRVGVASSLLTSLDVQRHRGVQAESLSALPWLWIQALGGQVHLVFRHYATDIDSVVAAGVATTVLILTSLAILAVLLRLRRSRERLSYDGVLSGACLVVALLLLGDKVFSPQYLLWLLGLLALALCGEGAFQRHLVVSAVVLALLTHLVFPIQYQDLLSGAVLPLVLLTGRDALLIVVTLLLAKRTGVGVRGTALPDQS